jgi:hypothetical protein
MVAIIFEKITDREVIANKMMSDVGLTKYKDKDTLKNRILDETIQAVVAKITTEDGNTFTAGVALYDMDTKKLLEAFTFLEGQGNNLFARFANYIVTKNKWESIGYELNDNNVEMEPFFKSAVENAFKV